MKASEILAGHDYQRGRQVRWAKQIEADRVFWVIIRSPNIGRFGVCSMKTFARWAKRRISPMPAEDQRDAELPEVSR